MPRALKRSAWWLALPLAVATLLLIGRPASRHPVHQAEWLDADGIPLRTVRAGRGDTTVLLLHGFGESLFTWRALVDPLAVRFRVVAPDLPGFGGSGKPDTSYSLAEMTRHVSDFMDRWTRGPVIAVGHSMGGEIAASLAIARPDRIVRLVLIAPAGWAVGLGGIADTMYPAKARAISWYLSSRAFILPEHDPAWLGEPDSAADYTLVGDQAYQNATARILEEFDFRSMWGRFSDIKQPTLVVWGSLDPVIPYALADSVTAAIPCASLETISGALHRPHVEVPDRVLSLIDGFVSAKAPDCH